jgi:broad specificity phosphatase PhoE
MFLYFLKQLFFDFILFFLLVFASTPAPVFANEQTELPTSDQILQRIYLVRHGESTANVYFEVDGRKVRYICGQSTEIPLTELGKKQISELGEKLARELPIETKLVILSSTAQRTQQTAKIIFEGLSKTHSKVILASEVYEGLNERSLRNWEGLLRDEKYNEAEAPWKAMSAVHKFFSPEVEGGESYEEVANRALLALEEIHSCYSGSTVIAVTSFHTINAIIIELTGALARVSTNAKTELPKLNLGNGDMVLLETPQNHGFKASLIISHIKL